MANAEAGSEPLSLEKGITAVVALLAAHRDDPGGSGSRPTEVVLSEAGLTLAEVAQVTGRKYETVKTNIRRYRERTKANKA